MHKMLYRTHKMAQKAPPDDQSRGAKDETTCNGNNMRNDMGVAYHPLWCLFSNIPVLLPHSRWNGLHYRLLPVGL